MVNLDADHVLLRRGEVNRDVAQVLGELAAGPLDGDEPRLDRDLDCNDGPYVSNLANFAYPRKSPRQYSAMIQPNAFLHPFPTGILGVHRRSPVTSFFLS
jgi:hypothetical protein